MKPEVSTSGEEVSQTVYLGLEECGGALIPQDKVGQLDFSRQRQLLGDSLPGEPARKSALLQSGELLFGSTRDAYGEIKPILQRLFEEQRHLDGPLRVGRRRKGLPPRRIDYRVGEFLQP